MGGLGVLRGLPACRTVLKSVYNAQLAAEVDIEPREGDGFPPHVS